MKLCLNFFAPLFPSWERLSGWRAQLHDFFPCASGSGLPLMTVISGRKGRPLSFFLFFFFLLRQPRGMFIFGSNVRRLVRRITTGKYYEVLKYYYGTAVRSEVPWLHF